MVKIKQLNIKAFRGIHELEIPLNGRSLLVCGENGTGKSSIADALEFFFTGEISHLEGTRGLSTQMHGPHVNYTTNDTKIDISFNPGNIPIEKKFFNEITPPTDLIDYFETTQKGTFILRRTQILAFISSQPADRFRALASIIGVDTLDEIELEMKRASDHIQAILKTLENKYNDLFVELTVLLEIETKKPEDILPHLNIKLKNDNFPEMKSFEHLKSHTEDLLKKVKIDSKKDDRIKNLNEIIDYTNHSLIPDHIENKLVDYSTKVKELLDKDENIKHLLSLETILKEGKEFIKSGNDNYCPLCEQSIDKSDLLEKIEKRLNIFRDLSTEASEVRIAGDILIDETKSINDKILNLTTKLDKIEEFSDHKKTISDYRQKLENILNKLSDSKDLKQKFDLKHIDQYRGIDAEWKKINIEAKQLIQTADLTEEEKQTLTLINLLNNVNSKNNDVHKAQKDISQTKYSYSLAEQIYNTFYKTKNNKIQQIYNSIESDIAKFYAVLHPNEPHGKIELKVSPGKRASTDLKMESFGRKGEDPRALASEGHLDSLGLCIFLGFVKNFNKNCTLIVLDDVVTTVDSAHRERICKLLFEEFNDNQFVITTHDRIWYEQLLAHQRSYNQQSNFLNHEILKWSIDIGPTIKNHVPRWDSIIEKIQDGDKKGAGNLSRQYLENILLNIAKRFDVRTLIKDKYDVGDLFPPIEQRFKDLLKEGEPMKTVIETAIQNLKQTAIMGNLLSHNNPIAENISTSEVQSFAKAVHDLDMAFQCVNCNRDLIYLKDLALIRCSHKKCQNPTEIRTK